MSFDTCKDVWVFIESFQGQPKSVGLELLGQGTAIYRSPPSLRSTIPFLSRSSIS